MTRTHNMYGTKLYRAWANMKKRCKSPTKKDGENYTNINYYSGWESFEEFMDWALNNGYKENLSLDRKDVYGDYTPDNCRWTSMKEQQRNKTNTKWIEYNGKTQSLASWAEELGFERDTLKSRILRGWSVERAFKEPLGIGRKTSAEQNRTRDELGRFV